MDSNVNALNLGVLVIVLAVSVFHVQLWHTSTGVYVGSELSQDRWQTICRYYSIGGIKELRVRLNTECPGRVYIDTRGRVTPKV